MHIWLDGVPSDLILDFEAIYAMNLNFEAILDTSVYPFEVSIGTIGDRQNLLVSVFGVVLETEREKLLKLVKTLVHFVKFHEIKSNKDSASMTQNMQVNFVFPFKDIVISQDEIKHLL